MATVALIDKKMKKIIKVVKTDRPQFTIDQLMRDRNPKNVVAREINDTD